MSNFRKQLLLLAGTILLLSLVVTDWLPGLRGPAPGSSEWYWPFVLGPDVRWWLPWPAAGFLLLVSIGWLGRIHATKWSTTMALIGLSLGSLWLQLSLVSSSRPNATAELIDRTLASNSNGYFRIAAETTDIEQLLHEYPTQMSQFTTDHARTHPPGLVLLNWLTIQAFAQLPDLANWLARPVWQQRCTDLWLLNQPPEIAASLMVWSLLPAFFGALTVFPAYWLARQLAGAEKARLAAICAVTLPGLLLFTPLPDQLFGFLSILSLLFLQKGLSQKKGHLFFMAGVVFSFSTFLSIGNGALILAIAIYAGFFLWQKQELALDLVAGRSIAFGLGGVSCWLIYWLGWGVPPWQIVQVGLAQHYQLVTSERQYLWWLIYDLVDLLLFAGPLLFANFVAMALVTLHKPLRKAPAANLLAVALLVFVVLLDLSGTTRGEAGRLWLFFMPLLAAATGLLLNDTLDRRWQRALIIGVQLLSAVALGLAWQQVEAILVRAERPAQPATITPSVPQDIELGETLRLTGYDLPLSGKLAGVELSLTLYWQAEGTALRPYTVFTHLLDEQGDLVAQQDNWPVNGKWPPTCWREGEVVVDPYQLKLPAELPPGEYSLAVGMYDAQTEIRLLTRSGEDQILLPDRMTR